MQHGMIGFSDAVELVAAINAAGRPAIVRTLWNDPATPGQAFDAGASCVIAPLVNSRAEAERLVRAAKYPPLGARSWGAYGGIQSSGLSSRDYLREANRLTMTFAMIETVEAVRNVDEIAATPGLDGLFVGPSDLSISLSNGAAIDKTGPATMAAMEKIAAAARNNGLIAGAFAGEAPVITAYQRLGYTFLAAAVDTELLSLGAETLRQSLRV